MKRRTVNLLFLYVVRALCMAIAVFSFIQLLGVVPFYTSHILPYSPPPNAIETSIDEINSNFLEWVGKLVVVKGDIVDVHLTIFPFNYFLVQRHSQGAIGVLYHHRDLYGFENVTVVGVVKGSSSFSSYIEAEVILHHRWLSETIQIAGLSIAFVGAVVLMIPFPRTRETDGESTTINHGRYPKRSIEGIGMFWLIGLVLLLIGVVLQMVATLF